MHVRILLAARREQTCNLAFAVEYALALHFRWMRGENRSDDCRSEPVDKLFAADAIAPNTI